MTFPWGGGEGGDELGMSDKTGWKGSEETRREEECEPSFSGFFLSPTPI